MSRGESPTPAALGFLYVKWLGDLDRLPPPSLAFHRFQYTNHNLVAFFKTNYCFPFTKGIMFTRYFKESSEGKLKLSFCVLRQGLTLYPMEV